MFNKNRLQNMAELEHEKYGTGLDVTNMQQTTPTILYDKLIIKLIFLCPIK